MEALFLGFFNRAMAAGWLVLAVLLLRLVFKKAPRWMFCLLWLLVGVRLLVPLQIESILSLVPSTEVISPSTLYAAEPTITTGVEAVNRVVNPVISTALAPNPGDSVNPLQVITILSGWVWLFGLAVMILYCLVSFLRLKHQVAEAVPEGEGVWLCEKVATPFILGFFRPRIYLPIGLAEPERSYVLAHERSHLSRRDHWIKPLAFVLLSLYWFHPLIWVAYILLCRDIELACDERVIRALGEEEKKPYSTALLTCSVTRRSIAACPLAFGEVGVKQRIVSILNYKKPAFWVILVAVILCIVTAVCFLTNPVGKLENPYNHSYRVEETLYHKAMDSTEYRPAYLQTYTITEQGELFSTLGGVQERLGQFQSVALEKRFFDDYFWKFDPSFDQSDAAALRRGTKNAWRIADYDDPAQRMYVLLQQKNGDLLLCTGYLDGEGEYDPWSDDSSFTHIFRLVPTGEPTATAIPVLEIEAYLYDQNIYSFTWVPDSWPLRVTAEPGKALHLMNEFVFPREQDTWLELPGLAAIELDENNFDRFFTAVDAAGWHDDHSAQAVRRENRQAWRVLDGDYMYYLLLQQDGTYLFGCGRWDGAASEFRALWRMKTATEQPEFYLAGALVGQHMGLSFMPPHGVDLGFFHLTENTLRWNDLEDTTRLELKLEETQQLSPEEFEAKLTESGILLILEQPEGEVTLQRYFSKEENTNVELYFFSDVELYFFSDGATWINLNSRVFEFVPEGTTIIPTEWPAGDDAPADDATFQERLDELLHAGTEDPLNEALMSVIQKYNHQEQGEEIISLTSFKILEQATLVACGADEQSSYTEEQILLAALYQEFDPEQGGMEPVTERFSLMVVKFEALENGTYQEKFFWQTVAEEWNPEEVRSWFNLGISGQAPDLGYEARQNLWLLLQNTHYQALSRAGLIDAQWEIRYLFDSIMDGYHRLGNNSEFREEYLDEYNRILCYGDETLRFVLREFMYGGQVDYRGVLLEEFLGWLMPQSSIDLYTETAQEYFDSWRGFMLREYERLGEELAFELHPRLPVFLEVMAEYNTTDDSFAE